MSTTKPLFNNILVATDFSAHADAAFRQAIWLARKASSKITLAHSLPDLRRVMYTASLQARMDLLYGEGNQFQQEIRQKSDDAMRRKIVDLKATDLAVKCETLLGEPYVQLTHAVQAEHYDLVMAGSRGLAKWETFFVGSTSKRLIRKCPASIWIVKSEHAHPPKVILIPTDFSDVSLKAVTHGLWLSQITGAEVHLLHVTDPLDLPEDYLFPFPDMESLRKELEESAKVRLHTLLASLPTEGNCIQEHIVQGTAWQEIKRLTKQLSADLIVMGTVGRSGIKGLLLGNTAERVLDTCDCSILTIKPDDFVSPFLPAVWPLHP